MSRSWKKYLKTFVPLLVVLLSAIVVMPRNASAQTTICSNQTIPAGDVVVQVVNDTATCGSFATKYFLSVPSDGLVVCSQSPVPAPYVVTSVQVSSMCDGPDSYNITHPLDNQLICDVSPIPGANASPVPTGFVVVAVQPSAQACKSYQQYTLRKVGSLQSLYACYFSPAPQGYVIDYAGPILSCGGGVISYEYRLPYNNIVVCPFSPIPTGWKKGSNVNTSSCNGQSPGFSLIPTSGTTPTISGNPNPVVFPTGSNPRSLANFTVSWNAPTYGQVSVYQRRSGAVRPDYQCMGTFGGISSTAATILFGQINYYYLTSPNCPFGSDSSTEPTSSIATTSVSTQIQLYRGGPRNERAGRHLHE
jgi:hypothetical protein